jgi:(S)-sulfolactate dehydrogenase
VVGRLGVGLDNIDVPACEARGMQVIPATGANALSVAEYVVATAMLLLRGAYQSSAAVAAGQWPRNALSNGREAAARRWAWSASARSASSPHAWRAAWAWRWWPSTPMMDDDHPAFAAVAACAAPGWTR